MPKAWERSLERWHSAGFIDAATAGRIRAWEEEAEGGHRLRWPVWVALGFGAIMVAAGILLFIAAHWERLSPSERFSLVLVMVALFHVLGAFLRERFPAMSMGMHAVGTAVLGGGIALAGQIFNLQEHWPGGIMLWALGAWLGWWLLRDWPQGVLAAILTPAWLVSEWVEATHTYWDFDRVASQGLLLLAITYFTAATGEKKPPLMRGLQSIGGLALFPCAIALAMHDWDRSSWYYGQHKLPVSSAIIVAGWVLSLTLPLLLAWILRRERAWMNAAFALWAVALGSIHRYEGGNIFLMLFHELGPYALCGLGAIGLIWWGVAEHRKERINMGMAGLALTVIVFYFGDVMDKLGRSESLIGMGILFLLGGWMLEKTRRRLVGKVRSASA